MQKMHFEAFMLVLIDMEFAITIANFFTLEAWYSWSYNSAFYCNSSR